MRLLLALALTTAAGFVSLARGDVEPSPILPDAETQLPELITKVEPVYPAHLRAERYHATVILQCVVKADGTAAVEKTLSSKLLDEKGKSLEEAARGEVCAEFEKAAVRAVTQWQYKPAIKNGEPVPVFYTVRIDFRVR